MKKVDRRKYRDKSGKMRTITSVWYYKITLKNGKEKRYAGLASKSETEKLRIHKQAEVDAQIADYQEPSVIYQKISLIGHLDAFREHYTALGKGNSGEKYKYICNLIAGKLNWTRLEDINADQLRKHLAGRLAGNPPISPMTANGYLVIWVVVCGWFVQTGRLSVNPLLNCPRFKVTRQHHKRRALSDEELVRLIQTAEEDKRKTRHPGPMRALVYRLLALSGLRAIELIQITEKSFVFDSKTPHIFLPGDMTKGRRDRQIPLHHSILWDMKRHIESRKGKPLWTFSRRSVLIYMLRSDLKRAGIAYSLNGEFADIHSFRSVTATRAIISGMAPAMLMDYMGHKNIGTTMAHYKRLKLEQVADAVNTVKGIEGKK